MNPSDTNATNPVNVGTTSPDKFIYWFDEISRGDIPLVGGKNANLGEMYKNLSSAGIKVPYGFAVSAYAYREFIKANNLDQKIRDILSDLNTSDLSALEKKGEEIRMLILSSKFPEQMETEIMAAYDKLAENQKIGVSQLDVAVRSSATAEDLPDASFAGQQESYLNVKGYYNLIESIKKCFASLFTNRAISYRVDKKFDHFKVALSVAVQRMVRSDLGASGVMFTIDTESGFKNAVVINAIYGLGDYIVQGVVTPDEFIVFKPTLKNGYNAIINKQLGAKEKKLIYGTEGNKNLKDAPVTETERNTFVLTDEQILTLAKWGVAIEEHYQHAMDIEWAMDGKTQELFIVQARPETVESKLDVNVIKTYVLKEKGSVIVEGSAVGSKIGQGKAHFIKDASQISEFKPGEVLVTEITDPDWEPIMKMASAIITDKGGRTSHAAIVSREIGIPAIVGTITATQKIQTGTDITVSCSEGEIGKVYEGILKFEIEETNLTNFEAPKTQIKMIVAEPDSAFKFSCLPNKGVGLAREEFIINSFIKIHPNALLNYDKLTDLAVKAKIDEVTKGYTDKVQFYVDKLTYGIAMIAGAFYPNEVILRFSDFKTNEYANLIGGKEYEPKEENPMIGWRGASRYYDPKFKDAFALECKAVKRVREELGLFNLKVMIPFCRTPEEGKLVIEEMKKNGLIQKEPNVDTKNSDVPSGLEVYVMAEIPSNIILAEEFAQIFDGFSIGSNDLTQLTLGIDRDSNIVSHIANEKNNSVKSLIRVLIKAAHKYNRKVGICGQGPSDYPDFAEFVVREGIDSISLQPDTVVKTSEAVKKVEVELGK
ncbi:MAG: phosphoenolpyruvate synthase [bacterium]